MKKLCSCIAGVILLFSFFFNNSAVYAAGDNSIDFGRFSKAVENLRDMRDLFLFREVYGFLHAYRAGCFAPPSITYVPYFMKKLIYGDAEIGESLRSKLITFYEKINAENQKGSSFSPDSEATPEKLEIRKMYLELANIIIAALVDGAVPDLSSSSSSGGAGAGGEREREKPEDDTTFKNSSAAGFSSKGADIVQEKGVKIEGVISDLARWKIKANRGWSQGDMALLSNYLQEIKVFFKGESDAEVLLAINNIIRELSNFTTGLSKAVMASNCMANGSQTAKSLQALIDMLKSKQAALTASLSSPLPEAEEGESIGSGGAGGGALSFGDDREGGVKVDTSEIYQSFLASGGELEERENAGGGAGASDASSSSDFVFDAVEGNKTEDKAAGSGAKIPEGAVPTFMVLLNKYASTS